MKAFIPPQGAPFFCLLNNLMVTLASTSKAYEEVVVSEDVTAVYGKAQNWFDLNFGKKTPDMVEQNIYLQHLPRHPNKEIHDFWKCRSYVPYNKRVNDLINQSLVDTKDCVGIHFRGTDGFLHVNRIDTSLYAEAAMKEMEKHGTNNIFICTDEEGIIEDLMNQIPDAKFHFHETVKSPHRGNGTALWQMEFENKAKLADDVILDCMALSKCKSIIAKTSNVVTGAWIQNPDLDIVYLDLLHKLEQR